MICIYATSKDLKESTNYASIARGKASKAKRQRMQAKKAAVEGMIINKIDSAASYIELKSKRQAAAAKRQAIAAKRLTASQKAKIA